MNLFEEETRTYLICCSDSKATWSLINTGPQGEAPAAFFSSHQLTMFHSSPSTNPTSEDQGQQEMFDALKQKYDRLVSKSNRKRRKPNDPTVEERARGIRKVVSLYTNISTLVATALAQEEGSDDTTTEETTPEEEQRRHRYE